MLVEIPDLNVILSVILAFLGGLGALYLFYQVRPHIKAGPAAAPDVRLEYYERELIDMKIRVDAMEMQDEVGGREVVERPAGVQKAAPRPKSAPEVREEPRVAAHLSPTEYVLQLITDGAMTSRDIQVTLRKSREHTSRLMKRLFEEGLVERNTGTKPYTYSITGKGRARAGGMVASPAAA